MKLSSHERSSKQSKWWRSQVRNEQTSGDRASERACACIFNHLHGRSNMDEQVAHRRGAEGLLCTVGWPLLHHELDVCTICFYAFFRDLCHWQEALASSHSVAPLSRSDECQEPGSCPNVQYADAIVAYMCEGGWCKSGTTATTASTVVGLACMRILQDDNLRLYQPIYSSIHPSINQSYHPPFPPSIDLLFLELIQWLCAGHPHTPRCGFHPEACRDSTTPQPVMHCAGAHVLLRNGRQKSCFGHAEP
jgi:hypothetical protein